ncbi:MAG: extracellular solute-binding protein [Clostridia bacterium]|nr:extracellular solute-binding protein [Clostridia bacterium]
MKFKKITAIVLCAAAAVGISGCGGQNKETAGTEKKLEIWMPLNSSAASVMKSFNESPLAKELAEKTGINAQYVHPPQGQELEKFNLLVASDTLPDIITYNWLKYPGGPQKAIREKVITDLNQYKDKAPNLISYLDAHEDFKKLALTDEGQLFAFPFIRSEESLCISSGLVIRKDWLDELGMALPETIDEWETVLTAFKEKKGASAPFGATSLSYFCGGFGTWNDYYVDNGEIKYGPFDEGYKDFIVTMNRWYKNGLIDQDFATLDSKTVHSNILNGVSGAMTGSIGSGIGAVASAASDIPGFKLAGAPYPAPVKGQKPEFGSYQLPVPAETLAHSAITTTCSDMDSALKYLDFGYSEEGHMLYNFGIEGESYEMIDGYPKYTEKITNNPEGLSMTSALANYTLSYRAGPFVQDVRYMEQYAALPEQKEAWENWSACNSGEHTLPNLYMKEDELSRFADISNSVSTYLNEKMLKMIIGTEPIENYDQMLEELRARGAEELREMYQSAYDRYAAR